MAHLLDIVLIHFQNRPIMLQPDLHLPLWNAFPVRLQLGCCGNTVSLNHGPFQRLCSPVYIYTLVLFGFVCRNKFLMKHDTFTGWHAEQLGLEYSGFTFMGSLKYIM